jgi:hypothetical protein
MPRWTADAVRWRNRRAFRLSNGSVELTVLTGGGHIADFRLRGSPINALWEAPWPTIEPQTFSGRQHAALYGEGPAGKLLSGYTGHALALGYFGMPSAAEAAQGLALHGEAASSEWTVVSARSDRASSLVLEVALPVYRLHVRREISLCGEAFTASIQEVVTNRSSHEVEIQWVQHAAFGEPLFATGEASLALSGTRGVTWPLGYEGHELLSNSTEYHWPHARSADGGEIDLSQAFLRDGTGFVTAVLTDPDRRHAFVAVHNRRHALVAGHLFDRARFPWIALWEESRARRYAPWNGRTRVRGVEFGTSPMPLGLDQAREIRTLFDTPVLTSIAGNSSIRTQYQLFLSPVPPEWTEIQDVEQLNDTLIVRSRRNEEIKLKSSSPSG